MKKKLNDRLINLDHFEGQRSSHSIAIEEVKQIELKNLSDQMGKAGYCTSAQRKRFRQIVMIISSSLVVLSFVVALYLSKSALIAGISCIACFYLTYIFYCIFLKSKIAAQERLILFQTPLILEALIQLVESGMGVLPAIYKIVDDTSGNYTNNTPKRILKIVYELSASGLPFSKALQSVAEATSSRILRHVLLHLDISGNEGGELIPSLRSLSDHSQLAWKLSVQQRVKRLENLVIFPVFISVLGLLCLSASVPLYPVLEFMGKQKPMAIDAYANK